MTYSVLLISLAKRQSIRNIKKFTLILRKVDKVSLGTERTPEE